MTNRKRFQLQRQISVLCFILASSGFQQQVEAEHSAEINHKQKGKTKRGCRPTANADGAHTPCQVLFQALGDAAGKKPNPTLCPHRAYILPGDNYERGFGNFLTIRTQQKVKGDMGSEKEAKLCQEGLI